MYAPAEIYSSGNKILIATNSEEEIEFLKEFVDQVCNDLDATLTHCFSDGDGGNFMALISLQGWEGGEVVAGAGDGGDGGDGSDGDGGGDDEEDGDGDAGDGGDGGDDSDGDGDEEDGDGGGDDEDGDGGGDDDFDGLLRFHDLPTVDHAIDIVTTEYNGEGADANLKRLIDAMIIHQNAHSFRTYVSQHHVGISWNDTFDGSMLPIIANLARAGICVRGVRCHVFRWIPTQAFAFGTNFQFKATDNRMAIMHWG